MAADELQALIPGVWRAAIDGAVLGTELTQLARRLGDENREVLPPREQWFRALEVTPLTEVRAVILGQDPYPTEGRADGLAFSVPDGQPAPTVVAADPGRSRSGGDDRVGPNVLAPMGRTRRTPLEYGAHGPEREGGRTREDRLAARD